MVYCDRDWQTDRQTNTSFTCDVCNPGRWWHHGWTSTLDAPVSPPGRHMGHAFIEFRQERKMILLTKSLCKWKTSLCRPPSKWNLRQSDSEVFLSHRTEEISCIFQRSWGKETAIRLYLPMCHDTKVRAAQVTDSGYSSTKQRVSYCWRFSVTLSNYKGGNVTPHFLLWLGLQYDLSGTFLFSRVSVTRSELGISPFWHLFKAHW